MGTEETEDTVKALTDLKSVFISPNHIESENALSKGVMFRILLFFNQKYLDKKYLFIHTRNYGYVENISVILENSVRDLFDGAFVIKLCDGEGHETLVHHHTYCCKVDM